MLHPTCPLLLSLVPSFSPPLDSRLRGNDSALLSPLSHLHPDRALAHTGADEGAAESALIPNEVGALGAVEEDGNIDEYSGKVNAGAQGDSFIGAFLLA